MLATRSRLSRQEDILAVLRGGRIYKSSVAKIYIKGSSSPAISRACVIVGKTVSKKAVIRHRYQRQLRQVAKKIITKSTNPIDVVIIAAPAITGVKTLRDIIHSVGQTGVL
ncbi:MAG: ribonuclease P protein component [Candidatus Sungbacteria bacterium]|nr:ribonuclease P protein component [Candidatus Sungbacteria bacterium]